MTDVEFSVFVEAYRVKAVSMASRMLKNSDDAQDAVQEAFVRAYRNKERFRGDSAFSTWFYRIVYTQCLNTLRKHRSIPIHETIDEDESTVWVEPEIFDSIDRETIDEILRDEMSSMQPLYAVVMDLFYVQECSYEQITNVTGMPLGTVKTRLNRGRQMLKDAVQRRLSVQELAEEKGSQL